MATAKRTGLGLIALAVAGLAVSMALPDNTMQPAGAKRYAIAISGRSSLRLIELGAQVDSAQQPATSKDRLLYCQRVTRAAGLEFGSRCASDATTFADASP